MLSGPIVYQKGNFAVTDPGKIGHVYDIFATNVINIGTDRTKYIGQTLSLQHAKMVAEALANADAGVAGCVLKEGQSL